ncbi:MAG: YraN family protein [Candidatus Omnitrophica bacterium]|nr:YraN family protein [Candidatus Omnitrophota bacterium]
MQGYKQRLGKKGERLAVQFLRHKGYQIIAKNFSSRLGEIDIIAYCGTTIVFIEVKTRTSCDWGHPQEAIGPDKIRRLVRCAQFYIKKHANPDDNFRFDVVSVILGQPNQIELIENAF